MTDTIGTQLPPNSTVPLAAPPAPAPTVPAPSAQRTFTEAEVNAERERVRKEEHDKLYPQVDQYKTRAQELEAEKKAREEAEAQAAAAAKAALEAEETRKRVEEMSAKELLAKQEQDFSSRLAEETRKREQMEALWQKEQQYGQLRSYRQHVLEANKDNIFPQFWDDLVGSEGDLLSSQEEVDARAAKLVARTQDVMNSVEAQQQEQRRAAPGVAPTSTPAGYDPMATLDQQAQQLTNEDIAGMSMAEYAKLRNRLPTGRTGAVSNRGLYG